MKVNATQTSLPQLLRKRRSGRITLTLALLLLTPLVAYGQISSTTARRVRAGSSLPATCKATNPVDIFIRTGATNPGFYICSSTNTWSGPFASLSAAAPSDATFITQTPSGSLSAEQAMSTLATGLVKNTTTTGVQSIATATDVSIPQFCVDSVGTDTYACSLSPAPASYVVGTHLRFQAGTNNTGAASINFNSLGALTLVKVAGGITTALANDDIRAGQIVECVVATGSNCQVQSTLGNAAAAGTTINATDGVLPYRSSSTAFSDSPISRIDANTIHQSNGANIQTWNIFNTYTDASNYSGLQITSTGNGSATNPSWMISEIHAGTGFGGSVVLKGFNVMLRNNGSNMGFQSSGGTTVWYSNDTGHWLANGAFNIGDGAGSSPVVVYVESKVCYNSTTVCDFVGSGSPESAVAASVGSTYRRTDGGAGTSFYVKESGTGDTGWAAK